MKHVKLQPEWQCLYSVYLVDLHSSALVVYLVNEVKLFGFLQAFSIQDHSGMLLNVLLRSQNFLQCTTYLLYNLFVLACGWSFLSPLWIATQMISQNALVEQSLHSGRFLVFVTPTWFREEKSASMSAESLVRAALCLCTSSSELTSDSPARRLLSQNKLSCRVSIASWIS